MTTYKYQIGIDEAGRGPLAGPVYVGFALASQDFDFGIFAHLDDSKRMTEKRRGAVMQKLADMDGEVKTLTMSASAEMIDEMGINPSIQDCIDRGLKELGSTSDTKVWLDGGLQASETFVQEAVIGGDGTVPAISLASVVAKEARDQHMRELHELYPEYGLAQHKGYGTAGHRDMIKVHGLSPVHRRTYTTNIRTQNEEKT